MSLIYIVAEAPWGPVKIETAASVGDMLRKIMVQPAHVEPCDGIDAGQVAEEVRKLLPAADGTGWTSATVAAATARVVEAKRAGLARAVAADPVDAAHAPPWSHGEGNPVEMAFNGMVSERGREGADCPEEFCEFRDALKKDGGEAISGVSGGPKKKDAAGRQAPTRPVTDVEGLRRKLGLSQSEFARTFGIARDTLQSWEQGRSKPDQTARAFLRVIECRPDAVREALAEGCAIFGLPH